MLYPQLYHFTHFNHDIPTDALLRLAELLTLYGLTFENAISSQFKQAFYGKLLSIQTWQTMGAQTALR